MGIEKLRGPRERPGILGLNTDLSGLAGTLVGTFFLAFLSAIIPPRLKEVIVLVTIKIY